MTEAIGNEKNNFKDSEKNRPAKLNRGSVFLYNNLSKKQSLCPPKES